MNKFYFKKLRKEHSLKINYWTKFLNIILKETTQLGKLHLMIPPNSHTKQTKAKRK